MKGRRGAVRARVVSGVSKLNLHPLMKKHIVEGETVYTDSWVGYNN
jgi:hypothetical protein